MFKLRKSYVEHKLIRIYFSCIYTNLCNVKVKNCTLFFTNPVFYNSSQNSMLK